MREGTSQVIHPGTVDALTDHSAEIEQRVERGDFADEEWDDEFDPEELEDLEFDADIDGDVPVPSCSTAGVKTGLQLNPPWVSPQVGAIDRISGCASAGAGAPEGETGWVEAHVTRDPSLDIATWAMSPASR